MAIPGQEWLAQDWASPIYAFVKPCSLIKVVHGWHCHEFICAAPHCKGKGAKLQNVRQFLDTYDMKSTGNL